MSDDDRSYLQPKAHLARIWLTIYDHLNFYRVHLLFFVTLPLVSAAIFYAANGEFHVDFIDALFVCVSASTVTGLATVDLSTLTGFQQALLFVQSILGSPVTVSLVMIYIRKYFFRIKFEHMWLDQQAKSLETPVPKPPEKQKLHHRLCGIFSDRSSSESSSETKDDNEKPPKLRPDMIRRTDNAPQLVDPMGWIHEGRPHIIPPRSISVEDADEPSHPIISFGGIKHESPDVEASSSARHMDQASMRMRRRLSDPGKLTPPPFQSSGTPFQRFVTINPPSPQSQIPNSPEGTLPRTTTIDFAPPVARHSRRPSREPGWSELPGDTESPHRPSFPVDTRPRQESTPGFPQTATMHTIRSRSQQLRNMDVGYGGFPMPHQLLARGVRKVFPKFERTLTRTFTIPRTATFRSQGAQTTHSLPYLTFEAIVGRNSAFHALTTEQLDELGGVEFRGLKLLFWVVAGYHIGTQLLAFLIIAPYISTSRWADIFSSQHRYIPPAWFAAFQVVSAYTNTGTSLVDTSMIPFQKAYPMIIAMIFLILAGNTAFPIFLRFLIWTLTKMVPSTSRMQETLHFLLDHPRRCFIYLFPSHQTWFLLTVILTLTVTDWVSFLVLDIGNPEIEQIPVGTRILDGILQACAVRAAGFGIVSLAALAPAVKVLYVTMMYISVYPIAMSVRSTNVYEERSLGIFPDELEDEEPNGEGHRGAVWGNYLAWHIRKQLAFDMWWLGFALWLICIVERGHLNNTDNAMWFNIFTIIFELVSAYGTVGLSLGIPTQNYSFSGALRPLSKLILCIVMIRGRHRGLPVAIDRAVILPTEFHLARDHERSGLNGLGRRNSRSFAGARTFSMQDTTKPNSTSVQVEKAGPPNSGLPPVPERPSPFQSQSRVISPSPIPSSIEES